jgi:hypothetical protein
MSKDVARSVLGILEGALEEGDRNLADNPGDFDKFTVQFHEEMKEGILRHVLDPIHAEFPTDVVGPADLVGHKVFFPLGTYTNGDDMMYEGMVTAVDPRCSTNVIIINPSNTGKNKYTCHWLLCRADHLNIMGRDGASFPSGEQPATLLTE